LPPRFVHKSVHNPARRQLRRSQGDRHRGVTILIGSTERDACASTLVARWSLLVEQDILCRSPIHE
jgi:hypothetical protein